MRRTGLFFGFVFLIHLVSAQGFTLISQRDTVLVMRFKMDSIHQTDDGRFTRIAAPGGNLLHASQQPDLPIWSCALALPEGAIISDSIISADTVYLQHPIVPGRGLSKGIPEGEYVLGKTYRTNSAFPANTAMLSSEYQLYSQRGQNLYYVPFRYFPQSGMLVIVRESHISIAAPLPLPRASAGVFASAEQQHFFNIKPLLRAKLRGTSFEKPAMLIVCTAEFAPLARKFMQWKLHQGTTCYLETFPAGVASETVKAIVSQHYKKYKISNVLIIGDAEQIPPMQYQGDSDAAYGFLTGDDAYAEAAVGRISASNAGEAEIQLTRIERYEQHRFAPRTNTYTMVASGEGPGDDGEYDYEHLRAIKSRLDAAGFVPGSELYDGDRDESDAAGDPSANDLADKINTGADLMYYIGHGDAFGLRTTKMSVADTAQLANTQWPFAMIGGCQVGNFVGQTCLAEAMLRTGTVAEPFGFAGVLASSNDQLWAPPMRAQDAFADAFLQNGDLRLGSLLQQSMRDMVTVYGNDGTATAATWNLFGDPSMVLHTKLVDSILANISTNIPAGATQLAFTADRAGAFYALSHNGMLVADGLTVAGENTVTANPLLPGEYLFTVFAPNTVCFMQNIQVGLSADPLLAIEFIKTDSDSTGLSIDCSHPVAMGAMVANVSIQDVSPAEILVSSPSPAIIITALHHSLPVIPSGTSVWQDSIALLSCKEVAPDYTFPYTATISSGEMLSSFGGTMQALTPQYQLVASRISPTAGSNTNTVAEAGEILDISLVLTNSSVVQSKLDWLKVSCSDNISTHNLTYQLDTDSITVQIRIAVSPQAHTGEAFTINILYGNELFAAQSQYRSELMQICATWEADAPVLQWKLSDIAPWTEEQDASHGTVMRSGAIGADGKSRLEVAYTSSVDDTISFVAKVSCEPSVNFGAYTDYYDFLEFSIDSVSKMKFAGEIDWRAYQFPVTAGTHVYAWEYAKDYDSNGGQDAAWLDSVVFPPAADFFEQPLVFSVPDTISIYLKDTLAQNITFTFDADTVILLGAPQWMSATHTGNLWQLMGIANELTTTSFLISCRAGSQYSLAPTAVQVLPRPVAKLKFYANTDFQTVTTGDSLDIHLKTDNSGNANSQPAWVRITSLRGLLTGTDSVPVPIIPPSGNFSATVRLGAQACLQVDTDEELVTNLYSANDVLTFQLPINITGINASISAIGFESGAINNGDSIAHTGEQMSMYATVRNASDKAVSASVTISTNLGTWHKEAGLLASNFFTVTGDEIMIPHQWEQNSLMATVSVNVGGCTFSGNKTFPAKQTSVAGYDTLWLALTQADTYELCLPDEIKYELLTATNSLVRTNNCLSAQLPAKDDTVLLGSIILISGSATGIAQVAAATRKVTVQKTSLAHVLRWSFNRGQLTIWSNMPAVSVQLVHISGIQMFAGEFVCGQPFSLKALPRGTYIVRAEDAGNVKSFVLYVE